MKLTHGTKIHQDSVEAGAPVKNARTASFRRKEMVARASDILESTFEEMVAEEQAIFNHIKGLDDYGKWARRKGKGSCTCLTE